MRVARGRELLLQLREIELGAGAEEERVRRDVGGRTHAHERRGCRHDRDVEFAALDTVERGEALGNEVVVRRELVVWQRFPVGQEACAKLRRKPADFVEQALRIEGGRGYDRDRVFFLREARERERVSGTGEPGKTSAGGEWIALHRGTTYAIISS